MEDGEGGLDAIASVERASVNLDQIRKLIRAHVTPSPRRVTVDWSEDQHGSRVIFIDIPAQDTNCLLIVAAPTGRPGTARTDTLAVPVRDADGTHWLPRTEIQRLLSAGVAASGMPTAQALSELLRDAMAQAQSAPAVLRIGQGLPGREREMREAYEQLAHAGLGQPVGEAYLHGLATLQDLANAQPEEPQWILCLVDGHPPVAVAAPVWQAIIAAGRTGIGTDPLAAVGYPVPPRTDPHSEQRPWLLPSQTRSVDLDGGSRGPGRLRRSGRDVSPLPGPSPRARSTTGRGAPAATASAPSPRSPSPSPRSRGPPPRPRNCRETRQRRRPTRQGQAPADPCQSPGQPTRPP